MNRAKIFIVFTFLLAFAACVSAQRNKSVKSLKLSASDKTEIINQVFDDGFKKLMENETFLPCTIPLIDNKKIILVRTIEPNIFPKQLEEYRFKFLSQEDIESEIKSNNGDCYFDTGNFLVTNSRKIKISLWRWIRVTTIFNGKSQYPSGWVAAQGLVYEATKNNGKWQIKFLNGTAVVS